ncbi:hypothetical protein [Methyloceanibacter caenitepidi]|uniref:Uncharacterized protein n=1 Tax=Methyloceanibacter caenitepidi TaxID=1384459 RepID=A0A0A8K0G6_9HYPH|nr:hypothetical protein [Methyloceanibacter caenitepidi]BAQ16370.1 hypothetical protein GL4_0910 [Methyloceanibacter caenitepidi]
MTDHEKAQVKTVAGTQSRHHVTGEDYPFEWARRFEHWLDVGHRRAVFYALPFVVFVIAVAAVSLVLAILDRPPV